MDHAFGFRWKWGAFGKRGPVGTELEEAAPRVCSSKLVRATAPKPMPQRQRNSRREVGNSPKLGGWSGIRSE
jgi:hypothetical protein